MSRRQSTRWRRGLDGYIVVYNRRKPDRGTTQGIYVSLFTSASSASGQSANQTILGDRGLRGPCPQRRHFRRRWQLRFRSIGVQTASGRVASCVGASEPAPTTNEVQISTAITVPQGTQCRHVRDSLTRSPRRVVASFTGTAPAAWTRSLAHFINVAPTRRPPPAAVANDDPRTIAGSCPRSSTPRQRPTMPGR